MFRKLALAAAAALSLGAVALAPTAASAFYGGHGYYHGGGWHGGWHRGFGGPRFYAGGPGYYGGGGCYVRRVVPTPWGPRVRVINRCY
jgi:hypothetical protein